MSGEDEDVDHDAVLASLELAASEVAAVLTSTLWANVGNASQPHDVSITTAVWHLVAELHAGRHHVEALGSDVACLRADLHGLVVDVAADLGRIASALDSLTYALAAGGGT